MSSPDHPVRAGRLPSVAEDPFSAEVLADPFPLQYLVREAGPVVEIPKYGIYAMARYEEVSSALSNWQVFQSGNGVGLFNPRREDPHRSPQQQQGSILQADPPYHDAPRHTAERILSPRALSRHRETWQKLANELVDELVERQEVDAMADLARAFPLSVMPDAIGIGPEGRENLLPYSDHLFNLFGPENEFVERGKPGFGPLSEWMDGQGTRDSLTEDGFGGQVWAATDRGDLNGQQARGLVSAMLKAGIDTTVNGLGALIDALLATPQEWQRLRKEPARARVAFDEAVRWGSPVQTFFRTTTEETTIAGCPVPVGEKVLLFLGAANRDPRRWHNPDAFDLDRDPSGHVGFGGGIHRCVGQHVARLEAECVIRALTERVARIEPAGEPVPHLNNTLRGWEHLPIRLVAA